MKILTDKLATENLATLPSEIWMMVKDEMDKKHASWSLLGLCLYLEARSAGSKGVFASLPLYLEARSAGSKGGAKCNY